MMDREEDKLKLISEEAAEWFVRIKDRDIDLAEQRKYVMWLKQSPQHVAEFLRLAQNFVQYRRAEIPPFTPEEGGGSNVVGLTTREVELSEPEPKRSAGVIVTWKIAAAIATVAFSLLLGLATKLAWFDKTIETGAGEWRLVALTDGSSMRVAPLTGVKIQFSDKRRTVSLVHGAAYFEVAKDKHRPFYVDTGIASVRAVGTQFGVARLKDDVTVTVSEGRVAVAPTGATGKPKRLAENAVLPIAIELPVSANEEVQVSPRVWPTEVKKVDAVRALAWARQRLIFENETIAQAAEIFNRLNRVQISVDDPTIAQYRACCVFDATDPEAFAESMAEESDIALVRDPRGVLHLVAETQMEEYPVQERAPIQADAF